MAGRLGRETRGTTLVEYALALGLIAIVCMVAFRLSGGFTATGIHTAADCISTLAPCGRPDNAASTANSAPGAAPAPSDSVARRWMRDYAWPALRDYTAVGFTYGFAKAGWELVQQVGSGLGHPLESLGGVHFAFAYPGTATYVAVNKEVADYLQIPLIAHPQQGLGELTFTIGTFFIPARTANRAAVVLKAGRDAKLAASVPLDVSSAGANASASRDGIQIPAWVNSADTAMKWTFPIVFGARATLEQYESWRHVN